MGWRDWGSRPTNSTGGTNADGLETNPSTSTLIAELPSTAFQAISDKGQLYQVTWVVGASTLMTWMLEQTSDTALGSTSIIDRTYVQTPTSQSGQYVLTYKIEPGQRLRCRPQAAITGVATAKISAEPLT